LLKYEFINRIKNPHVVSNELFAKLLQQSLSSGIQVESIEKTFRKPSSFVPEPFSIPDLSLICFEEKRTKQPFNKR
jgi:hypothetical protein